MSIQNKSTRISSTNASTSVRHTSRKIQLDSFFISCTHTLSLSLTHTYTLTLTHPHSHKIAFHGFYPKELVPDYF
jgi:hypothetical protein